MVANKAFKIKHNVQLQKQFPEMDASNIDGFNGNRNQAQPSEVGRSVLETIMCFCIFAYIFLTPFPHMTFAKGLFLYGGFFTFLLTLIRKNLTLFDIQKVPLIKPLLLFTCWAFLGLFSSIDISNSLHDFHSYLLRYLIFYVILVFILQRKGRIEILGNLIIASVFLISTYLLYNHFFLKGNSIQIKLSTGFPEMPVNWVGFLLAPAQALAVKFFLVPPSLKHKKKVRFLMALALAVFFLITIITQSRATSIVFFLVFLSLFFFKNWKLGVVLLIVFLTIFSFSPVKKRFTPSEFSVTPRMLLLLSSIEIVKQYPIFGLGYGFQGFNSKNLDNLKKNPKTFYRRVVPDQLKKKFEIKNFQEMIRIGAPHNIFASVTVRTGIIGGGIFIVLLSVYGRNTWLVARKKFNESHQFWAVTILSAFCGIICIAAVEPVGHHIFHTIFFTFLGMGSALFMQHNQPAG
nr:O-antigen ligase family protein [uncultured Desulfobacter sp.]